MIVLVDYGAGNLRSVANALAHLGYDHEVSEDPAVIQAADKIIFPGVGAAASCMRQLRERGLDRALASSRRPLLGICLGMQMLAHSSTEGQATVECLGVLPGDAARFQSPVKLPQIGWNTITKSVEDPLLEGIESGEYFYFLHSYRVRTDSEYVIAETEYGETYPSVVRHGNFWGVQFHPEKSGDAGLKLLTNFLERC